MMPYAWLAIDAAGRRVRGQLTAQDESDLEGRLARMRLDLVTARPLRRLSRSPLPRRELIEFCFQIEQLLHAGLPLLDGLTDLRNSAGSARQRDLLADLIESIHGGKSLSAALAAHPHVFDEVFRCIIQAGEESGRLTEAFSQLRMDIEWRDELMTQTRKLIAYPCFLAAIVVGVIAFISTYLAPRLAHFMHAMGQQTPLSIRALIGLSDIVAASWPLLICLPAGIALLLRHGLHRHAWLQRRRDTLLFSLPLFGNILRKLALARLAAAFSMMHGAGVAITRTLHIVEHASGNLVVRDAIASAARHIDAGKSMTQAFRDSGLFPPLAIRMIHTGETTGALDTALTKAAHLFNRDARESIDRLQGLLEPVLTIVVGALLGTVMLSALGPLYNLIARLQP